MPISNAAFVRSTVILLIAGMIALLGIVGTSLWLVSKVQTYFAELVEVREVRSAAADLLSTLKDAETGQRGFVITGEENFREPYDNALKSVAERQQAFAEKVAGFPEYAQRLTDIRRLVTDKLSELAETVAAVEGGQSASAVALVKTDRGRLLMDELRDQLGAIMADADRRLQEGVLDTLRSAGALQWTTVIGAIAIIGVMGGAALVVAQYTRDIIVARREVETLNATLERRVDERTEELIRANQEVQRFAYIVTHDLRAPLVNIMGFTSELETGVGELSRFMAGRSDDGDPNFAEARTAATEDLPEAITFIRAATRKMDSLINAILKISREGRRQLKPETLNLTDIVEATVASVQHQIVESGGSASVDIQVPRLTSDRLSLEQALGNLLDNSVKYQQPGRPLVIAVRARHTAGNRIEIEVEDNGRGIAAADHERVFELFRRAGTQTQPGEGIGLAHVRTMVRSLGGDIALRSELGVGTTFIVTLPRDLRSYLGSQTK